VRLEITIVVLGTKVIPGPMFESSQAHLWRRLGAASAPGRRNTIPRRPTETTLFGGDLQRTRPRKLLFSRPSPTVFRCAARNYINTWL